MPRLFLMVLFALNFAAMVQASAQDRLDAQLQGLIEQSDFIGLIEVPTTREQDSEAEGLRKGEKYRLITPAKVMKSLKGESPADLKIYHMSNLGDFLFTKGPGRYLVFLKRNGTTLYPTKGTASALSVEGQDVTGWTDTYWNGTTAVKLDTVLAFIEARVAPQK